LLTCKDGSLCDAATHGSGSCDADGMDGWIHLLSDVY
jgi:hypothetical protein